MTRMDDFTGQLARLRKHYAAALDGKIAESFAALEKISNGGDTAETVVIAHRRLHEMCGIAPTLGLEATGRAARSAEAVLREAAKGKCALAPAEITAFKFELEALRRAAARDLSDMGSGAQIGAHGCGQRQWIERLLNHTGGAE